MDNSYISALVTKTKKYTTQFLCIIYGIKDKIDGDQVGSGLLVRFYNKTYIITAAHVIKEINNHYNACGVSFYGDDAVNGIGPTCRLSNFLDVAMIPFNNLGRTPFLWDVNNSNCKNIENDILYIHGNPASRSKFIAHDRAIHSESLSYATGLGKSSYEWFNPDIHLALHYPWALKTVHDDSYIYLPDPHGLSGSGVWRLNIIASDHDQWQPENAQLIGIVHNWDTDCSSLVATKVEAIKKKKPT